jgi:hypothetical protein
MLGTIRLGKLVVHPAQALGHCELAKAVLAERFGGSGSGRGHGSSQNIICGAKLRLAKSRNTLHR